jgi:hypothetical protein
MIIAMVAPLGAGGREEQAGRLAVRAGEIQRKVSNGIAGLATAGSSRHRQKIAAIPASASILPRSWH